MRKFKFIILLVLILLSCKKETVYDSEKYEYIISEMEENSIIEEVEVLKEEAINLKVNIDRVFDESKVFIVLNYNIPIYDSASSNANIIRESSFPNLVTVYESKGTGRWVNGILDSWYRISDIESEWINYQYISSFPFVVSSKEKHKIGPDNEYNTMIIESYYFDNDELYFNYVWNLNSYYHDNLEGTTIAVQFVEGIDIVDNYWTRLYNFCESVNSDVRDQNKLLISYTTSEIIDNSILLDYGVSTGISKDIIESLFGDLYINDNQDEVYKYCAYYIGFGYTVSFYFENEILVKIEHEIEK